jgi:DNA-binding NarL/FixJ family response regulator
VSLIRVLMANRPRLIRELVMATISDQPDFEIVGEVEQDSELESLVESKQPDVLIVALDRTKGLPRACQALLRGYPQMKVIAIATDRNCSMFYWASLHIESQAIETSEAGVLGAIRSVASSAESLP